MNKISLAITDLTPDNFSLAVIIKEHEHPIWLKNLEILKAENQKIVLKGLFDHDYLIVLKLYGIPEVTVTGYMCGCSLGSYDNPYVRKDLNEKKFSEGPAIITKTQVFELVVDVNLSNVEFLDPNKSACCQAPFKEVPGFLSYSVYKMCSKCGK